MRTTMAMGLALLAAAAVACGDDGDDPDGSATVEGTLAERTVSPEAAYVIDHPLLGVPVLVMPEDPAVVCSHDEGEGLDVVIGFICDDPAVGTFPVGPESTCGETPHVFLLVEGFTGEFNEYLAESGSVEITALDGEHVAGTFTGGFGDKGDLTGTFDALVCGAN